MKNKKKTFRFFAVPEWQKEEEYLSDMHRKGWKFVKMNFPGIYHFEKCEPEDVVYRLDFNPDGISNKAEYQKMFEDCGWEYLQDCSGYSYFRKSLDEGRMDDDIFCDDESRLEMINRVYRGKVIPLIIIFCGCIIPQLLAQSCMDSIFNSVLFIIFLCLMILYMVLFVKFGIVYGKLKKKLKR